MCFLKYPTHFSGVILMTQGPLSKEILKLIAGAVQYINRADAAKQEAGAAETEEGRSGHDPM
jgi:hypothetical protein